MAYLSVQETFLQFGSFNFPDGVLGCAIRMGSFSPVE
jgi:hypothetical protein